MFEIGSSLTENKLSSQGNKRKQAIKKLFKNKQEHQLVFTYEKRKGKLVTLIGRFYINDAEKKDVLKLLKKKLACGGCIKEEWIEIQGDVKEKIKTILIANSWKFKN